MDRNEFERLKKICQDNQSEFLSLFDEIDRLREVLKPFVEIGSIISAGEYWRAKDVLSRLDS